MLLDEKNMEKEVNTPNVGYNLWTGRATLYTAK